MNDLTGTKKLAALETMEKVSISTIKYFSPLLFLLLLLSIPLMYTGRYQARNRQMLTSPGGEE